MRVILLSFLLAFLCTVFPHQNTYADDYLAGVEPFLVCEGHWMSNMLDKLYFFQIEENWGYMVSVPASNEARMSVFDFEHIDDGRLRIAVPEYAVVFPMVDDEPWTTAWSFEVNINNDAWASDPWIPVKREVFEDVAQVSMNCFFHQVDEE